MLERFRDWFGEGPVGITVPVGVMSGYALFQLLGSVGGGFLRPILLHWRYGDVTNGSLTFHWGGYVFDYQLVATTGFATLTLGLIMYFLFVWRASRSSDGAEMRDCPACKNQIWSDATRCGFCTSVVEPLR
jgi:large conductance mechanosensitive channel